MKEQIFIVKLETVFYYCCQIEEWTIRLEGDSNDYYEIAKKRLPHDLPGLISEAKEVIEANKANRPIPNHIRLYNEEKHQ